jgi:hypothetical protein
MYYFIVDNYVHEGRDKLNYMHLFVVLALTTPMTVRMPRDSEWIQGYPQDSYLRPRERENIELRSEQYNQKPSYEDGGKLQ